MPGFSRTRFRWPAGWLDALESLVFPMSCLACDADGTDGPFCLDCKQELLEAGGEACPRCALPRGPFAPDSTAKRPGCAWCRKRPLGFDDAVALGPYQGPIREACLRLKRSSGAWLAPWLADLLLDVHGDRCTGEAARGAVPWVVPVPLHWVRRQQRGFNQAEALARRIANRLQWPMRRPIRRVQATHHLADLGRRDRAEALRTAFRVRETPELHGRTILLVDDILTSGATSGAAARALKRAGARRVVVAVIGRAEETR